MSQTREYVGVKSIEAANYDGKGNNLYNMWITDEEIVRCRDCRYVNDDPSCTHPRWRYGAGGVIIYPPVDLNGFCSWGERRD